VRRRRFIQLSTFAGASAFAGTREPVLAASQKSGRTTGASLRSQVAFRATAARRQQLPELSPAKWIWYPSERTLPNTFILLRRLEKLSAKPRKATGWIVADSRYQFENIGQPIRWGLAARDPRWAEADLIDIAHCLHPGENALGATVLYFSHGETRVTIPSDYTCDLLLHAEEKVPLKNAGFRSRRISPLPIAIRSDHHTASGAHLIWIAGQNDPLTAFAVATATIK
jgi:hypothetical protein